MLNCKQLRTWSLSLDLLLLLDALQWPEQANLSKKARTSTIDRDGRERTERTQTKGTIL